MSTPDQELRDQLVVIQKQSRSTFDTAEIEHLLVDLVTFLQRHPEDQSEFEKTFIEFAHRDPHGMTEALEFTMHTLKWPEVRARVVSLRDEAPETPMGYRQRRWAERILDSYEDEWENAPLYDYYA